MNGNVPGPTSFRRGGAVLLASAFLMAAGAAAQERRDAAAPAWIGDSIGIAKPAMTLIGHTRVVRPGADLSDAQLSDGFEQRMERIEGAERMQRSERKTISLIALNAVTGETYRLEAPRADFERLHLEMVMRGEASAKGAAEPDAASGAMQAITDKSWSDGIANFTRRGIADGFPANQSTYQLIGQIGSACTGTLIGPRHVLTAAHCVVDNVTLSAPVSTFRPRRDWSEGTVSPTQPHGSRSMIWYYFPEAYWDGTCNVNSTGACNKYDIALAILSSNMSLPYMGYWYASVSTLDTWNKWMRGYPRCLTFDAAGNPVADVEAPPGCQRSTLYGDINSCDIGSWWSPDADGWNRELSINCDGARGMSGSALYTPESPGGLVALGVYSQFACFAENCEGNEFPNTITRITPEYAEMISMGKSLWSCASGTCP